jgi:hypothetical protein
MLNSKFAFARYQNRSLEVHVFFDLVRIYLEVISEAHKHRDEEHLESLVLTLYDQILSLYAHHYLGEQARHPHFEETLYDLCQHFKESFFDYPDLFSLLAHSTMNMSKLSINNLENWAILIKKITFSSLDSFKRQSFIAAWLTGCPAYREKAVEYLNLLDHTEFNVFFDLDNNSLDRETLMGKLGNNPWYNPFREKKAETPHITLKVIGGFKGFDQIFVAPPRVFAVENQLYATDSVNTFQVYADTFGVQWISAPDFQVNEENKPTPFPLAFRNGAVLCHNRKVHDLPELYFSIKSIAFTPHTCFVTSHSSHKLFVFGLEDGEFNG